MGLFIHKKEKYIVEMIKRHADLVVDTVKTFQQALDFYLEGDKEKSREYTKEAHKIEGEADIVEREIDKAMYAGAFMPSVREALYIAVDIIDKVANRAEKSGDFLTLIQPEIPEEIREYIKKMGALTLECAEKLKDGIYNLFDDIKSVFEDSNEVEYLEGEVDKYAWRSVEKIFRELNLPKFSQRMMLREMIIHISSICNKMEDASDKLDIIAIKLTS